MSTFETSLGGPQGAFPETTWSLIVRLGESQADERRPAIEKLSRKYWRPLYRFIRMAWAKNNDDAKDLTQAFFVWLMEGETLAKYAPDRGSFRGYLKGLVRRFVADDRKASTRLKRGGGVKVFPLNDEFRAMEEILPDPGAADPDRVFDQAWKKEIVDTALGRVRAHFSTPERSRQLRVFEEYDLAPTDERPTYEAIADRLGIKTTDVRNHLFAVRERLRSEIQTEISETVSSGEDLQEEWSALFA